MQAGESQSSLWVSLGRMRAGQPARGLLEARPREGEQSTPDLGAQQQRTELDHSQEGVIPLHTGQQQHCTRPVPSHPGIWDQMQEGTGRAGNPKCDGDLNPK